MFTGVCAVCFSLLVRVSVCTSVTNSRSIIDQLSAYLSRLPHHVLFHEVATCVPVLHLLKPRRQVDCLSLVLPHFL